MSHKKLRGTVIAIALGILIFSNTSNADSGSVLTGSNSTGSNITGSLGTGSSGSGAFQIIIDPVTKRITVVYDTGSLVTGDSSLETGDTPLATGTEFQQSLSWMYTNGLTRYDNDTDYRPADFMTREEAAKIIGQAYIVLGYAQTEKNTNCTFTDMDEVDPTLSGYVLDTCKRGLFKGSNGKFMPTKTLTRPEAMAVLIRMFEGKISNETQIPRWSEYYLKAWALGLTTVNNQNAFDKEISRQEIAIYIFRLKNIVTNETLRIMGLNKISQITSTGSQQITTGVLDNFSSLANSISVSNDPELQEAISRMNDNGLTSYSTIADYKPFEILLREQSAKILYMFSQIFGFTGATGGPLPAECIFKDINNADPSLVTYIENSCQMGIMKGADEYFNPKNTINKSEFITTMIRLFEGRLDENVTPRRTNYFQRAQTLGIVSPADLVTFENPITRYEVALFLYRFKIKYQMLQNLNTSKVQNEVISSVPGSLSTGLNLLPEGNIYIDMNLLENGNFEIGYIEVFGVRYKIVKSTTEKYFSDNFVRYGDVYSMDTDQKIGTVSFVVSNGYVVDGTIRLPTKTYQISQLKDTNAYYKMKQIK